MIGSPNTDVKRFKKFKKKNKGGVKQFRFLTHLTSCPVIVLALAVALLAYTILLGIVHHFSTGFPPVRGWREKLAEGINQTLCFLVKTQATMRRIFFSEREQHAIVTRITFA